MFMLWYGRPLCGIQVLQPASLCRLQLYSLWSSTTNWWRMPPKFTKNLPQRPFPIIHPTQQSELVAACVYLQPSNVAVCAYLIFSNAMYLQAMPVLGNVQSPSHRSVLCTGMVTDQGWPYLARESSLDAMLNISLRRADELERTFFSIRFWCLVDFDHSIPRKTWTLLALCLGARSSIWYFIWICEYKRGEQVKYTVFILLIWRESSQQVWFFTWWERTCC